MGSKVTKVYTFTKTTFQFFRCKFTLFTVSETAMASHFGDNGNLAINVTIYNTSYITETPHILCSHSNLCTILRITMFTVAFVVYTVCV